MRREWRERADCRFDYGEIFFEAGFPFGESRSLPACLFVDLIAIYQVAKPITDEALNYWEVSELLSWLIYPVKWWSFIRVRGAGGIMVI